MNTPRVRRESWRSCLLTKPGTPRVSSSWGVVGRGGSILGCPALTVVLAVFATAGKRSSVRGCSTGERAVRLSGCRPQRASRRGRTSELGFGQGDCVEFSCVTDGRELDGVRIGPRASTWGCCGAGGHTVASAGAELLDCGTAWAAHSSGRQCSRSSTDRVTLAYWISGGTQRHGVSARPQGAPLRVSRETAPNVWAHRLSPRMRSNTFTGRVDRVPGEGYAPLWPVRQRRVEAGAVGTPGVRGLRRVPGVDKARCGGSNDLGVVRAS